ncbi:MAG TPA: hypothetical protein PK166_03655 [Candidatus Hydrogenedentes bacterium]|nr:hypothetical protein [Candidatus Hydrogenedentota bacterium]
MRKLKPFVFVFVIGIAAVAFGLAGQQALSEGADNTGAGACPVSAGSSCGMAKAAAIATASNETQGSCCSRAKADETADLSTREGRRQAVMAEYAAAAKADPAAKSCEGAAAEAGCASSCPAKAEGNACCAAAEAGCASSCPAKAEGNACCAAKQGCGLKQSSCGGDGSSGAACAKTACTGTAQNACPSQEAKAGEPSVTE